jgi:hypothetical protein
MKNSILILVFISISITAHAQIQQEQAILELSKKKFQWMITMNYDSLEPVLDERMVFIHSNGWGEIKTEFIEDIKTGKLRYTSINVLEASVRLYSGSAVIIGRGKFNVKLDGKDLEFDLKYTEFYVQKNGKWLLASRHSNRLQ